MPEINQITTETFGITISNPDNIAVTLGDTESPIEVALGSPVAWGTITGNLSNQADLQSSLAAKISYLSLSAESPLSYNSSLGVFSLPAANGSQDGYFSSADFLKLSGIQEGATANSTDADLLNRSNHTGTQPVTTITGLGTAATLSNLDALWNADRLQGRSVAATVPTSGQSLRWNGSAWEPATPTVTSGNITDSTATGRSLVTAVDAAAGREALGAPAKPATSTLNAIARYSDASGNLANSTVTINNAGDISAPGTIAATSAFRAGAPTNYLQFSNLGITSVSLSNLHISWLGTARFTGQNTSETVAMVVAGGRTGGISSLLKCYSQASSSSGTTSETDLVFEVSRVGNVSTAGTLKVGSSGTPITRCLSAIATLDFPSIAAQSSGNLTVTVTGATVGDSVTLGLPAAPTAGLVFNAFVSAANTVTVRATNVTGAAIDPASASYRVTVIGF